MHGLHADKTRNTLNVVQVVIETGFVFVEGVKCEGGWEREE